MKIYNCTLGTLLATILLAACAPPLEADDNGEHSMRPPSEAGPNIDNEVLDDGSVSTIVDATAEDVWVYLDLETGREVEVADPLTNGEWDLGFRRFHVKLNGGVSGGGSMEAVFVPEVDLADLATPPADGYVSDAPDGDDDNEDPDYVLRDWYAYNVMTHVLTPEAGVYVVRSVESGFHYGLEIVAYYDDAGTSGTVLFEWKLL